MVWGLQEKELCRLAKSPYEKTAHSEFRKEVEREIKRRVEEQVEKEPNTEKKRRIEELCLKGTNGWQARYP